MKKETINKAVKIINRKIRFYQRKLTYYLELKAESNFHNGALKLTTVSNYDFNIKKYEIILADLSTIKRAIKNNKTSVKIFGTLYNRGYIYNETVEILKEAGFDIDGDGFGTVYLLPTEEFEEEEKSETIEKMVEILMYN